MKTTAFLVFFSTVLLVYGSVNYYILLRGYQGLEALPGLRKWYWVVMITLALSYIAGRVAERFMPSVFSDVLTWTGSFWLAAMLYFLMAVIDIDIIRLVAGWLPVPAPGTLRGYPQLKLLVTAGVVLTVAVLLITGYFRAVNPVIRQLDLNIPSSLQSDRKVRMVMVSDIHLGTLIGKNRLNRLLREVESLQPDIIVLAGDIVDEDLKPVIRQNLGEDLRLLRAPLGVWGITGNHEYIGGAEKAVRYLREHGINILRDSVVNIDSLFLLAGREDRDKPRFSGNRRKELEELLAGTETGLPVILLDHQPFNLDKAVKMGVALQLSGHTHHGQVWPLHWITNAIYEISHGYLKKGNTHFYVSSGYGSWGPPVRIGTRSEIVLLNLTFEAKNK